MRLTRKCLLKHAFKELDLVKENVLPFAGETYNLNLQHPFSAFTDKLQMKPNNTIGARSSASPLPLLNNSLRSWHRIVAQKSEAQHNGWKKCAGCWVSPEKRITVTLRPASSAVCLRSYQCRSFIEESMTLGMTWSPREELSGNYFSELDWLPKIMYRLEVVSYVVGFWLVLVLKMSGMGWDVREKCRKAKEPQQ